MLRMHRVVLSEDSGGSIEVYDDDADDDDMPPQLIIFPSLLAAGEDAVAGGARIGVSIEPRAELEHKEASPRRRRRHHQREDPWTQHQHHYQSQP